MQIRRVEIVRNFVAQQIEAIPENRIAGRLIRLNGDENVHNDHSERVEQRRSRSEQRLHGSEEDSRKVVGQKENSYCRFRNRIWIPG